MFYDLQKVLSYNCLLNFIVGERGVGKTYGTIKFAVNDFLKNGNQFVYIRRYKTELQSSVPKFFDALNANNEFGDDVSLKSQGNVFKCNKQICGYAVALSNANILKSTSFAKVKTIIFDEFIIDKGCYHYLQNEVHQFLDVVETIGRLRDIRCFLLGNAISKSNPYYLYFNLGDPYGSEIKTFKDGLILVNYIANMEYREVKKNTRFGKLIDGTEYGSYAIDNQWLNESKVFIEKRPETARFYIIIKINNTQVGVWHDYREGKIYFSKSYDPSCPIIYALNTNDHSTNTTLLRGRNSNFFKVVLEHYRNGSLCFENQKIKQLVLPYLNKYVN